MRYSTGRRWWPWAVAIGLLLAGLASLITALILGGGLSAAGFAALSGAASLLALPSAVLVLLAWARKKGGSPRPADAELLEKAWRALADEVESHWLSEVRAWRLHDPDPIPVLWWLADRALGDQPRDPAGCPGLRAVGTADDVGKWFRRLDRRRLVILGEPGTGKTTLAAQLVLGFLRKKRRSLPVPVMFSLSSFDPQKGSLSAWLGERIVAAYPEWARSYSPEAALTLIKARKLLPVLDGLDEVPERNRQGVLGVLNNQLTDGKLELIVTCRAAEYRSLAAKIDDLQGAWVIQPDPITADDARTYLERVISAARQAAWKPVLSALDDNAEDPVSLAFRTPLTLWLARQVYRDPGREPGELADHRRFPVAREIQAHLLGQMVPVLFTNRASDETHLQRRWQPPLAQQWLTRMAFRMSLTSMREISWRNLTNLCRPAGPVSRLEAWHRAAIWLGVAGPIGAGVIAWLAALLAGGLAHPYLSGLTFGFTAWTVNAVLTAFPYYFELVRLQDSWGVGMAVWGRHGLFSWSRRAAITVLTGLIAAWFVVQIEHGLAPGAAIRLVLGVTVALATALAIDIVVVRIVRLWPDGVWQPAGTMNSCRWQFACGCVGVAIVAALGLGLSALTTNGPAAGLTAGLLGALGAIAASAAFLIRSTPWGQYARAHAVLAVRGQLPWRLKSFFADCHEIGLLRQQGDVYEFRHALLQDQLARAGDQEEAS